MTIKYGTCSRARTGVSGLLGVGKGVAKFWPIVRWISPPSYSDEQRHTTRGWWPAAAVGGKAREPDDAELALSSRPVHRVELPANPAAENARGIAVLPSRLSHPRSLTCCCYLVSRSCEPSHKRARPKARRWCRRASRSPRPCTSSDENPGRGRSAGWSTTCCRRTWSATSARCTS